MNDIGWDKRMVQTLKKEGLTHAQAMIVVGIIAEERQKADREGYVRGYNNGCTDTEKKG
jgi:hypothetical protein